MKTSQVIRTFEVVIKGDTEEEVREIVKSKFLVGQLDNRLIHINDSILINPMPNEEAQAMEPKGL